MAVYFRSLDEFPFLQSRFNPLGGVDCQCKGSNFYCLNLPWLKIVLLFDYMGNLLDTADQIYIYFIQSLS